jgi:toxin-antitoxin system PIN domain toxin
MAEPRVEEASGPWFRPWPGPVAGDLPDINVWLALAVQEHPHHEAARRYWADARAERTATGLPRLGPDIWFCRVTMLGLVRLLCQPRAVGPGALDPSSAWALYARYRALPFVGLLAEPEACDVALEAILATAPWPPRLWTDAYLAALARSAGLRLVTFDRDFERFRLERCRILAI